jgi:hypothetical protein
MSDQALLCHLSLKLVRIGDGLSSPWGGVLALYQRRILTTNKHAHNKINCCAKKYDAK